jgi:archaellum biogenesis ATPase FlaH
MKKLKMVQHWLSELIPEGLPFPTSTLISGPGGSGKPLIGLAFVTNWLKSGGNVIFIPLQYPEINFINTSLHLLYNLSLDGYPKKVAYIQFNYDLASWRKMNENTIEANLLKPTIWEKAVNEAENILVHENNLGTLVFASALNLLLFSHTYKETILDKLEKLLKEDKKKTYIFSVSTSAFQKDIKRWENAADNLMFVRMEKPMKLYLKIKKLSNKKVPSREVHVPIKKEILEGIKEVAESVRMRDIPNLQKI